MYASVVGETRGYDERMPGANGESRRTGRKRREARMRHEDGEKRA